MFKKELLSSFWHEWIMEYVLKACVFILIMFGICIVGQNLEIAELQNSTNELQSISQNQQVEIIQLRKQMKTQKQLVYEIVKITGQMSDVIVKLNKQVQNSNRKWR